MSAIVGVLIIVFGVGLFGFSHERQQLVDQNRHLKREISHLSIDKKARLKTKPSQKVQTLDEIEIRNLRRP